MNTPNNDDLTRSNSYDEKQRQGQPDSDPDRAAKSAASLTKLKSSAAETVGHLKDAAASVSTDAKDYAGSMASDAAGAFKEAVESNKTAGADAIANIAHSVKEAADGIEKQSPQVAGMVRSAAEGVERISTDVRDRNVGELLELRYEIRAASAGGLFRGWNPRRRDAYPHHAKLGSVLRKGPSQWMMVVIAVPLAVSSTKRWVNSLP